MSVVTFLANAVGPAVAAAAAQSALGELAQGLKRKRDKADEGQEGEVKNEAIAVDQPANGSDTAEKSTGAAGGAVMETEAPSQSAVERAASVALGAAAAKASALAQHEQARLSQLVSRLVAAQVRKVELKLNMFERMEEMLEEEKRRVELGRQSLFKEKVNVQAQLARVEGLIQKMKEEGESSAVAGAAGAESEVKAVKDGVMGASTAESVVPVQGVNPPPKEESSVVQL
jgi:SWI/SNF related-matrix-associated actin-dependent regulator of chromatin subfamily C